MSNWLLRGLAFAAGMVVLRVVQGALINIWQTQSVLISIALLILFVIGVVVWGVLDGRADALANPDPDRRDDLAMTWLLAGLVAGLLSGAASWLVGLFDDVFYVGGLANELTTFAAFTALVVFLPAIAAVTGGRWSIDRSPRPVGETSGADGDRADTDVFSAVRADDTPTGGIAATQAEEQTSALAVARRAEGFGATPTAWAEEPADTAAAAEREEPTEAIAAAEGEETTDVHGEEATGAEQTNPTPKAEDDQT